MLVAATVLEGLLDPVVEVIYCLEQRQIRSQPTLLVAIICMTKYHFYAPKSICGQIVLPCLCPPRAIHALQWMRCQSDTLAFIKFRIDFYFLSKTKLERLSSVATSFLRLCFISYRNIHFFQSKGSPLFSWGGKGGVGWFPPHLQVPLTFCWAESIWTVSCK